MRPLEKALALVGTGEVRIAAEEGMVYRTFVTSLYTYERPVGAIKVNGYVTISLGRRCSVNAHRLIWAAVNGLPRDELMVNHINGIKHDNRITNLELVTAAGNIQHGYDTGLIPRGERHVHSKITDADVDTVRQLAKAGGLTHRQIAARFGISSTLVSLIKNDKHRALATGVTP